MITQFDVATGARFQCCMRLCLQLLCLIGEAFGDHSAELCGAVVNIRNKGDKVAVWTSNGNNRDGTMHVG